MAKIKKPQPPCRADMRSLGFAGIPKAVIQSEAYRDLSLWARAVFVEIVAVFDGYNNGKIALSITQICERLSNSNRRAAIRAVGELVEHGLVEITIEGSWARQHARQFRLTFASSLNGKMPVRASNEYLAWRKSGSDGASLRTCKSGNGALPPVGQLGSASLPRLLQHRRKTAEIANLSKCSLVTVRHPL